MKYNYFVLCVIILLGFLIKNSKSINEANDLRNETISIPMVQLHSGSKSESIETCTQNIHIPICIESIECARDFLCACFLVLVITCFILGTIGECIRYVIPPELYSLYNY